MGSWCEKEVSRPATEEVGSNGILKDKPVHLQCYLCLNELQTPLRSWEVIAASSVIRKGRGWSRQI
jgi:hypothetical protein